MSPYQFDTRIAAENAKIVGLISQMQAPYERFLQATADALRPIFQGFIDDIRKDNPAVIMKMSEEDRTSIKEQLAELVASIPTLVTKYMGMERNWSHKKEIDNRCFDERCKELYAVRNDTVSEVGILNALEAILLTIPMKMTQWGMKTKEPPWSMSTDLPAKTARFQGRISWSTDMVAAMAVYSALHDQIIDSRIALRKVEEAKLQADAEDLWEKA